VPFYEFDIWAWITHAALFATTTWSSGRATPRLMEVLRYGRVPLHVYLDEPWVPYQHSRDFWPPGTVSDRLRAGGSSDVTRFGAVLQDEGTQAAAPSDGAGEPAWDAALWKGPLNDGGLWGPGGYGFPVHIDQLPAFLCIACEFVKEGSAARWRRVRVLPLHRYGKGAGLECPCTPAGWAETVAPLGSPTNWTVPRSSLLYEMEMRGRESNDNFFSYAGIMTQLEAMFINPGTAALKCVPRPLHQLPTRKLISASA
jgi:hypothetical protein